MFETFKTRLGALCMVLVLVFSMAVSASAADSDFTIENGVLTKYNGSGGNVVIPDGVTEIGVQAFINCSNLTSVTIPDSVTHIRGSAFSGCGSLTSIAIPDSVAEIGSYAFDRCGKLTSVTVSSNSVYDRLSFNRTPWWEEQCKGKDFVIVNNRLLQYAGSDSSVVIPDGVTSIGLAAFGSCTSLTSVTIPSSVTSIGGSAFYKCGLTSVTIPDSVTEIGGQAFSECRNLTSVTIPKSVVKLGRNPFEATVWGIKQLDESGFLIVNHILLEYKGKPFQEEVVIPDGVMGIGEFAFYNCTYLKNITIPDGVTSIGDCAFQGCTGLTSVTLPGSVKSIGRSAFIQCTSLKDITIPASVTEIGGDAFTNVVGAFDWISYYPLDLTVHGAAGSYAEKFASENGLKFAADGTVSTKPPTLMAYASTQTVQVDSKPVKFQMYALKDAKGNPTNYVKVRDVAQVLNGTAAQFNVTWENGAVNLVSKTAYVPNGSEMNTPYSGDRPYQKATASTNVNGQKANLDAFTLTDDNGGGYTYYQLRDLGKNLGFNVGWSKEQGIFIETDKPYQT